MAALDEQLAVSPSEVKREDIWPLDATEAGEVQGDTEESQTDNPHNGDKAKVSGLGNAEDDSSSGKIFHDVSSV